MSSKSARDDDADNGLNDDPSEADDRPPAAAPSTPATSKSWYPADARSPPCRRRRYTAAGMSTMSVTLVVDVPNDRTTFSPEQVDLLSRLQTTVQSLLGGAQLAVNELVVVSHGRVPMKPRDAVRITAYLQTLEPELPRAAFVVDAGRSQAAARTAGFEQSNGTFVVFADLNAVGTVGWLKPLVEVLFKSKSVVVVQPHFDDGTGFPNSFRKTSDRLVVNYIWPLTSHVAESADLLVAPTLRSSQQWLYRSPTVHGNVFAVRRKAFDKIGGYDGPLSDIAEQSSAGAHLELSMRAWLCGATIQTALCSHVGLQGLSHLVRVKVQDPASIKRIGDLWFAKHKEILFRSTGLSVPAVGNKGPSSAGSIKAPENGQCSTIDWYFRTVVKDVLVPSENALYFGQLKAKTGVCAHVNELNGVDVVDCSLAMQFELTASGQLMVAGADQCLTVQSNSYVVAKPCYNDQQQQPPAADDGKLVVEQQLWRIVPADASAAAQDQGQLLVNVWSNFCAMHVTDPLNHSVRWRQIVMAQNCSADFRRSAVSFTSNLDQFTLWSFIQA